MTRIFVWSSTGTAPLDGIASLIHSYHGFAVGGGCYGVVIPKYGVDAMTVIDALTAAGVNVMPSIFDNSSTVGSTVATALTSYGATAADTMKTLAGRMFTATGNPLMRAHLY